MKCHNVGSLVPTTVYYVVMAIDNTALQYTHYTLLSLKQGVPICPTIIQYTAYTMIRYSGEHNVCCSVFVIQLRNSRSFRGV